MNADAQRVPELLLCQAGDHDTTSPPHGVRVLEEKLGKIGALYGGDDKFKSILYEDTGHEYTPEMKVEMAAWLERWLK